EQPVPAAIGLQEFGSWSVNGPLRGLFQARIEALQSGAEVLLVFRRETNLARRPGPRGRGWVDLKAKLLCDSAPLVLVCRMQPTASEIDRETAGRRGPGTAANAVSRLENKRTKRSRRKPGGRRHSGCPRADYHHIDFVHRCTD